MTSVRTRILLFFTLFAAMALSAIYMASRSTQVVGNTAVNVIDSHFPMVMALAEMDISLKDHDISVYRYLITGDKQWIDECERARVDYARWFTEAKKRGGETIEQDKLVELDELYVQYDNQIRQIFYAKGPLSIKTRQMLAAADQYLIKMQKIIDEIEGIRRGMTIVRQEQIRNTLHRHKRVAIFFPIIIIGFFLVLAYYLLRYLVQPLSLLLDGIRNFTRGEANVRIPRIGKDELGELQEAFNEMSEELEIERKRLKNESQSDSLTGLFNMRFFRSQLVDEFSRSQRYGRPLTLLMIDVDYFKAYNDKNGHPAGDIVLKEVSRILTRNVRGTDVVARYGGEEFVILLPETALEAGVNVAEKMRKAVEDHNFPFSGSQGNDRLTISIGVASYPHVQVTSDQDLIEASDKALYTAKKSGRNRVSGFTENASLPPLKAIK